MYLIEHYGYRMLWRNVAASVAHGDKYCEEAIDMRDDMPALLVNANQYLTRVMESIADTKTALGHMESMSFPYVLWLLYKGAGKEDIAKPYEEETLDTLRRYPDCFAKLPASYRAFGEELLCKTRK